MRPRILLPLAVALVLAGTVAVVATRGQSCEDALRLTESRFRQTTIDETDETVGRLPQPTGDAVGPGRWALTTGEAERGNGLVELGSWIAYATRTDVSRIDPDGTIRWTRATPRNRVTDLGDGRLGVLAFVDSRMRLAIVDGDGELLRCDRHGPINGGFVGDGSGGYAMVAAPAGSQADADDAIDQVRRIEPDGSERWVVDLETPTGRGVDEIHIGGGLTVVGRTDPLDGSVLTALDDATGEVRWIVADDRPGIRPVDTIHGVVDGRLYVTIEEDPADDRDDRRRRVLALDAATGESLWAAPITIDTFAARAVGVDDTVVLVSSGTAMALDPRSGDLRWTGPFGAVVADGGDHGAAITEVDDRLLYPAGSGRLLDLRTGRSTLLFGLENAATVASTALDDDLLLVDMVVSAGGSELTTVLTGWTFEPARADLDVDPVSTAPDGEP